PEQQQQTEKAHQQQGQKHNETIVPGVTEQVLVTQAAVLAARPAENDGQADVGQQRSRQPPTQAQQGRTATAMRFLRSGLPPQPAGNQRHQHGQTGQTGQRTAYTRLPCKQLQAQAADQSQHHQCPGQAGQTLLEQPRDLSPPQQQPLAKAYGQIEKQGTG